MPNLFDETACAARKFRESDGIFSPRGL